MKKACSQLAWGLALELIDFRFNAFDLFPDVVGLILILLGLSNMPFRHRGFAIAKGAAGMKLAFLVLQMFGLRMDFSLTGAYEPPAAETLALVGMVLAVDLAMLYGICGGIRAAAQAANKSGLAAFARDERRVLFALGTAQSVLLPCLLNFEDGIMGWLQLSGFGYLVASFWVILLVRRAGRELSGPGGDGDGSAVSEGHAERRIDIAV